MTSKIILKKSSVAAKVPLVADLEFGELALNYADGKLFYKKSDNTVQLLNASGTGSGDMLKATYDTDDDGKVNSAEFADAVPWGGITGVPSFSTVATTGAYSDLTGTPVIGTDVQAWSANLDSWSAIATTTKQATLVSGSNIRTVNGNTLLGSTDIAVQATLVSGTNIKSIDGTSLLGSGDYTVLPTVGQASGDIHGIVDRTASTISFNEGTRTFTITPVSGSWTFYNKGTLYTISSAKSLQIADVSGTTFIRFNVSTLNLEQYGPIPDFSNDVIVAYIYWNATTQKCIILGDERHGSKRDTTWHSNQHLNVGTIWRSGGGLTYTLNNAASVQLGVGTPLVLADEDLAHTINHSATPTLDYEQVLNTAASLEVLYLNGTVYTATTPSTTPWVAGTSLARYNLVNTGSGSLVDAGEGKYITYWLLGTNDTRRPVKLVLGRAEHSSLDAAYAEEFTEYGLSFAEQVFMYQIVVQTSASYTGNTAKIVVAAVRKVLSKVSTSASTVSATQHNVLTGREAADSHPIAAISGLSTALSGKQDTLTSGTNIKTVNGTTLLGSGNVAVGTVTSVAALTIGTTGTDVGSTVATGTTTPIITLNIPTANATNRGALSSGDWTTFNSKQAALVSGTNIKTINGNSILGSGDLVISGGSGGGDVTGPASSAANHLVTFAGTTGKVIQEATYFDTPAVAIPAAPATGDLRWFARSRAGRVLPHIIGPSGIDVALQPGLFGNSIYMWLPGTGTTLAINWGSSFTARNNGTGAAQAHPTKTSTNAMTSLNRATFGTGTSATGASGVQSSASVAWRGNAANLGGFFFFARFGIETFAADMRVFVGLSANNATMAADSSTWANTIGLCKDSADSAWQLIQRNATTATKTPTGLTVAAGTILDLIMFAPPNGSNVTMRLVNAVDGTVYVDNVVLNTTLPVNTTFLFMQAHCQSVTGTTAKLLALNRIYVESDL